MLIHFCPRLLTPAGFDLPCELIDIRIKEFDLHLLGGRDVVARHPLPDKRYHVACRKSGCKAVNGLLVDVEKHVPLFTVDTRWSIDAEVVLRHRVEYVVLDAEHDAVSDYMLLWCDEVPNYFLGQSTPAMQVPLMELMRGNALQTERQDVFRLPTLRSNACARATPMPTSIFRAVSRRSTSRPSRSAMGWPEGRAPAASYAGRRCRASQSSRAAQCRGCHTSTARASTGLGSSPWAWKASAMRCCSSRPSALTGCTS